MLSERAVSRTRLAIGLACLLVAAVACSFGADGGGDTAGAGSTELTVFAAASLTESFGEIGTAFEAAHPGTTVTLGFGPSDGLAAQIESEGRVDVFASASPAWMDELHDGPGVIHRADFARNRPILITPTDNPAGIVRLGDLAKPGVKLVLAAEDVPIGTYARAVLVNAGIADAALANVVSNEEDVKGIVQKVVLGEADAGIVYQTDVTGAVRDQVHAIEIPDAVNVIATYPIGVLRGAPHPHLAKAFVNYVLAPDGQAILRSFGFLPAS